MSEHFAYYPIILMIFYDIPTCCVFQSMIYICNVTIYLHLPYHCHLQYREEETEHNVGRFVWPTAVLMLEHIISHKICHDASLIIELGAGCGVLGMGLAHAMSVVSSLSQDVPLILTDHDEEWLQRNVDLNKTEIGKLPIEVTRLDWRNRNDIKVVQDMIQQRLSSLVSDNKSEPQLMILASDVLYNHDTHEALANTLHQLSKVSKHTRIIIGFLDDRGGDELSFSTHARELFGDAFKPSKPVVIDTRGRKKELQLIDFTI